MRPLLALALYRMFRCAACPPPTLPMLQRCTRHRHAAAERGRPKPAMPAHPNARCVTATRLHPALCFSSLLSQGRGHLHL
ncbi:MAG: hypothetical protein J3K34DRAFT_422794, partial [Monoraphidium minutum]